MMFLLGRLAVVGSVFIFPWSFAAVLAVLGAFFEPMLPLAMGLVYDALYYSRYYYPLPLYTLAGALVSGIAHVVRVRVRPGMMR